jgi:chlorobactene glucosyltransferase
MTQLLALQSLYYIVLVVLAVYFFALASINIIDMRTHTRAAKARSGPLVSVLIPARNEEANLGPCLASLQSQSYQNYEILVIDDNSTDSTAAIARAAAEKDRRVRFFSGAALPEDWYGKPYALEQLSRKAKGDIFIFTDADTIHGPDSVSWAVSNLAGSRADFISGYIKQDLLSLGERLTVPLMFFLTGFAIPIGFNRVFKNGTFAAAVGQFIAVRSDVFRRAGGFEPVKKKTSEDIYFVRHIREQGYKTLFLDIKKHVHCRMYHGYRAAMRGIGKNIFDFFQQRSPVLLVIALAVLFFLFLPFPLLIIEALGRGPYLPQTVFVNILFTLTWIIVFIDRGIAWVYALFWPLMFLNLLYMAAWSWFRTVSGKGFLWKGRVVR